MKTNDAARLACIKQMVADGLNADELEAMTDREVQDRFTVWLNIPRLRSTRLDSADAARGDNLERLPASVQKTLSQVDERTANLIAKIIAAHPTSDVEYLKTKSIEYLTARVELLRQYDRDAGRQEETNARGLNPTPLTKDSAMFNYDAERQATEDAYQRSKANLNPSSRHDAGAPRDHTARGDSSTDFRSDAEAAEDAYQRSKAALNANHSSMQHHRGSRGDAVDPLKPMWVR